MLITYYNVERQKGKIWEPVQVGLTCLPDARMSAQFYASDLDGAPCTTVYYPTRIVECRVVESYG